MALFSALDKPVTFAEERRQERDEVLEPVMCGTDIAFDIPAVKAVSRGGLLYVSVSGFKSYSCFFITFPAH